VFEQADQVSSGQNFDRQQGNKANHRKTSVNFLSILGKSGVDFTAYIFGS
jgi:hypothetical protein